MSAISGKVVPVRQVRAAFNEKTVRVYQAFPPEIASAALAAQKFVSPFKRDRMTWIKPSFTWMMYRCGWAEKQGQERVLEIEVAREGFEWALAHSCLSHFEPTVHTSLEEWESLLRDAPVRIQWDPERNIALQPLPFRTIQVGLSREAVDAYVDSWIRRIEDVTPRVKSIAERVRAGDLRASQALAPREEPYPLSPALGSRIGCHLTD